MRRTAGLRAARGPRRLLAAALCVLAAAGPPRAGRAQDAPPPLRNVLFIMGDDHAEHVFGAYGNPLAQTPNLDRLAAAGVRFDRAYVNAPVCSASRQSILTGLLPHAAGVTLLFTPFSVEKVTIADHLKRFGFATGAVGKMHFNSDEGALRAWGYPVAYVAAADDHHGFDVRVDRGDWRAWRAQHPGRPVPPGVPTRPERATFDEPLVLWNAAALPGPVYEEHSTARFYADRAIEFMAAHRDERFCLWLSFHEPHQPFDFPVEDAGRFDPSDMPLPEPGPEDERWIPQVFRGFTDAERRGVVSAYYTSVAHLDRQVGRVLDAVEAMGLDEQTLVVYVGDHGYLLGHHGRFEKHTMWEEAVRTPLVMKNVPRLGRGRSTDALVEFVDLVPTIVDLLGVPAMPSVQGRSLVPLLDGAAARHRDYVFSEYLVDDLAMVRTERWKYVFTAGRRDLGLGYATGHAPPGPTHRLYDVVADPGETRSLAGEPAYRDVLARMQALMLDRFTTTHPEAGALPDGLSTEDRLVWFTRPRDPLPDGVPVK